MNLPPALKQYADRIDAMTLRERALVFLAAASILVGWTFSAFIAPLLLERSNKLNQMQVQQAEMKSWDVQLENLARAKSAAVRDGTRENRLAELHKLAGEIDRRIAERSEQLVPPDRMRSLLADIVRRNPALRLGTLGTLPATLIEGAQGQGGGQMYRHGMAITVSGAYSDIVSYLAELESLPVKVFWGDMEMSSEYPVTTMKISVFTYSPEKTWLSL